MPEASPNEAGLARRAAAEQGPQAWPALRPGLLRRKGRLLDFTRPIFEGMPQWPSHQNTFAFTNYNHARFREIYKTSAGFEARTLLISEHCGTHCDAIFEYDETGPRLDETPLEFYWGEAVCLDLSDVTGSEAAGERCVLRAADRLAERGQQIRPGDIALLWFDFGDRAFPSQRFIDDHPGLSFSGAEALARMGVVNIGTDCASIDSGRDPEYSAHMACRRYGIVTTSSLTGLGRVLNTRFLFFALPLHLAGGTGSPVRAVGWFPDSS